MSENGCKTNGKCGIKCKVCKWKRRRTEIKQAKRELKYVKKERKLKTKEIKFLENKSHEYTKVKHSAQKEGTKRELAEAKLRIAKTKAKTREAEREKFKLSRTGRTLRFIAKKQASPKKRRRSSSST